MNMSLKYISLSKWLDNFVLGNVLPIVIQDNITRFAHIERRGNETNDDILWGIFLR